MDYCVAIRTLGTAGEKYQTLLDSLNRQTIRPKKILVYIPDGYDLPKETIGWEEYIRSPKGMITQRSLSFDEIETEYILFCDDDLWLADDFVEQLYRGLQELQGDCISPDIYKIQGSSFVSKIKKAIAGYAFPRRNDGWAFKIMRNGGYTYNSNPKHVVLPTQSAAGACMLIRKNAYQAIHFEDERWMEDFGFTLGEDLLFYYKLYTYGFKVLIHFAAGIEHLDGGTGSKALPKDWMRKNSSLNVVVPYRIKYNVVKNNGFHKFLIIWSCCLRHIERMIFYTIKYAVQQRKFVLFEYIKGLRDGWKYVHSSSYLEVPKFDSHIKK